MKSTGLGLRFQNCAYNKGLLGSLLRLENFAEGTGTVSRVLEHHRIGPVRGLSTSPWYGCQLLACCHADTLASLAGRLGLVWSERMLGHGSDRFSSALLDIHHKIDPLEYLDHAPCLSHSRCLRTARRIADCKDRWIADQVHEGAGPRGPRRPRPIPHGGAAEGASCRATSTAGLSFLTALFRSVVSVCSATRDLPEVPRTDSRELELLTGKTAYRSSWTLSARRSWLSKWKRASSVIT